MKRRFTILTAAFALLAFLAIPMGMMGQTRAEVTYTFSEHYNANTTLTDVAIAFDNSITGTFGKGDGSTAPQYYTNGTAVRWYGGNTLNITASNATISEIVLTYTQKNKGVTTDVDTYDHDSGIWSGSASSVTFTVESGSGHNRVSAIKVTYSASSANPTCATPTFSPAAGTYTQAQNVSISCATEGATIYYTTDGNDPTTSSTVYSEAINVSSNTTIKAMAAKSGYDNSAVASATYTIVTPMTIAEVRAQQTGDVLTTGTVTSCVGTTGYIQDATAAICVYGTSLTVGDNISVLGTLSTYNGLLEITNPQVTVVSSGNTIEPETMTIAQAVTSTNQGWYIRIEDASVSAISDKNVTVAQGDDNVVVRFANTSDITFEVNDIISLNGNIGAYNGVQIANPQNVTVQEILIPTVTVTPSTINAPFAGAEGTLALTYENIENFISFDYYFCDANGGELEGNDPDWIYAEIQDNDDTYSLNYIIDANDGEARTAFIKVYTFDDNLEEVYAIVTVNQEAYVAPTYAELPFSFNGGKAAIEETDGLYQEGLGSDYNSEPKLKFDSTGDWLMLQFNERPGTLTFDIKNNSFSGGTFTVQTSEDGVTYTDLETYTEITGTQNEEFTDLGENVRYIKWIYTTKVSGNVGLGNIALAEYVAPVLVASITVNPNAVELDAEEHDGTLPLAYENLTITDMTDFDIQFCDANGEELSEEPDWIEVLVAGQDPEIGEGYVVSYYMVENEGPDARTAYFKVYAMDDETNLVYSNLVTISQAAPMVPVTGDKYVKVTSTADLTSGQYLIVYEEGLVAFDGSLETLDAASNTIEVTINDSEIGIDNITIASEFTIDVTAGTIMSASGYYIGQTSNANGMQTSLETAYTNTISFDEYGNANIVSSGGAYLRYNSANNQNRFRYYKSSSYTAQKAIQLYKKVGDEPATETYTLEIAGYGNSEGGFYLIASPVAIDPTTVEDPESHENMILIGDDAVNYDLYVFDQTEEDEWRNYKQETFNLQPGKGYLYAHKRGGNFAIVGVPYSGNGEVTLSKTTGVEWEGWNLVGNPFCQVAYITDGREFYTMNDDGSGIMAATSTSIEAMEGIFVIAEENGETMTFTTEEPNNDKSMLALNLSNGHSIIDRAIVSFNEGRQLPKFQLRKNSTKVFIEQDNKDYAVVNAEEKGEMPVSFKAENNGSYSLSINTEGVSFNYLHLIDNMTGADIDLLATPSYSFEARTNDYKSRFRLVFNANDGTSTDSETFAFFIGNNLVINNEGEATLQVIDMMGRVLSSEQICGSYSNSLNLSAGVYVLRLSNGNTVKTQKIVID